MSGCRTWQGRRATAPPRFRQGLAAIDHQRLPGDEAGLARGQEQRRPADVAHAAQTPQRHRARHLFQVVRAHLVQPLGEYVAGQDRVDRDAVARQFQRGGAHETQLRGLAGRVVRPARIAGDGAGDRRGQDHATRLSLLQPGQTGLQRARRAHWCSAPGPRPARRSLPATRWGRCRRWRRRCLCRHGPAPRARGGVHRGAVADVRGIAARLAARGDERVGAGLGRVARARHHGHAGAMFGQDFGDALADAGWRRSPRRLFPGWKQTWRAPCWMEPHLAPAPPRDLPGQLLDRARRLGSTLSGHGVRPWRSSRSPG